MLKSISHGISARVAPYQPKGRRPRGLICHAIWILACIILFIIYFKAEIAVVNEDKILKYLTTDLFVVTYFFIVTSLICIFARVLILICIFCTACWYGWLWRRQYHAVQILHNHYQVYDKIQYHLPTMFFILWIWFNFKFLWLLIFS